MTEKITMTDADAADGLRTQVNTLTQIVSQLSVENAALRRTIVEREAADAAGKEKKPAEKKP